MKVLIVYDSMFGNTERVAQAMAAALRGQADITACRVGEAKPEQWTSLDLLIVGSPTQAFRPTPAIKQFLRDIPAQGLTGIKVAAFDTRISVAEAGSRFLTVMVNLFGYAAKPIARQLQKKAGELIMPPEGFIVAGKEGPLQAGEFERAAAWARQIMRAATATEPVLA